MTNIDKIIAYESGDMQSEDEILDFFSELIKSGLAWQLQGHYGRMAHSLIQSGMIDPMGNIVGRN